MTIANSVSAALEAFHRAAQRVPAYQALLQEKGIRPADIMQPGDFARLPVLEKRDTFQRFEIAQLCVDGKLGDLASVLTSSGHSGVFAYGLAEKQGWSAAQWTDDQLDAVFQVRSKPTLLINCLPMGVKIATEACTLAETSVRPDMAVALMRSFGRHFAQIILVGEAALIKKLLELGRALGVDWPASLVHVIAGEEPLAENARRYLEGLLGIDLHHSEKGMVISSMGVAEIGLNLFFEAPPARTLVRLRRRLHENPVLRKMLLGPVAFVPCLFCYDPRRIYVEFDGLGRLLVTTLDPTARLPLVRYATGDRGGFLPFPDELWPALAATDIRQEELETLPLVAIYGRGDHAHAGEMAIHPEAIKEGIYHDAALAAQTTANFRLISGAEKARVRLQLSPGVAPDPALDSRFAAAIKLYVRAPVEIVCESYESFGHGMALDYERKFDYLELAR